MAQLPREIREQYRRVELPKAEWLEWERLPQTRELVKALRLKELNLRFSSPTTGEYALEIISKAEGLATAILLIEQLIRNAVSTDVVEEIK